MAMSIMNNSATAMTLGELNKNIRNVGKQITKLSSGQRLNGAADDASGYAISEKMRVQLRGLDQDIENVQTGSSLLKVAAGGIDDIVSELRSLKELSINAANDHNFDLDRETLQKEYEQRKADIEDIASSTNYNGKILLDGRYTWESHISIVTVSERTPGVYPPVESGVTEPSGAVTNIPAGADYTISGDGIYEIQAGFTGKNTIADGAKNVEIRQANPNTALQEVHIDGPASGNANLWLDGLNVANAQPDSFLRFHGSDNVLSIKGNNKIDISQSGSSFIDPAVIHIGGGLTVEGTGSLTIGDREQPSGAYIGTDANEKSQANLTVNSGTFKFRSGNFANGAEQPSGGGGWGGLFGSGHNGSMGDITINGGTFDLLAPGGGPCIGSAEDGSMGNITIRNAVIKARTDDGACIGSGFSGEAGDILIENSRIDVASKPLYTFAGESMFVNGGDGAGIGSGGNGAKIGNITIRDSNVLAWSNWGAGIGSGGSQGRGSSAGDITLENTLCDSTSLQGEDVGKGYHGTVGTVTPSRDKIKELAYIVENGTPLIIHTGTKANQNLHVFINDMRPKALGIDMASVTTRDKATKSLSVLDSALEYALGEVTTVGAYISRLNYTKDNLTTSNENTQASESTIRDADMAKEMTGYTRNNILAQAAPSMLAQANHNTADVLNLLQS